MLPRPLASALLVAVSVLALPGTQALARPVAERLACAVERDVCVHAAGVWREGPTPEMARGVLDDAVAALRSYEALDLARPLSDGWRGGSAGLDVYLVPTGPALARADPRQPHLGLDAASAYLQVPGSLEGCRRSAAVARGVAEASMLGLDAALHPSTLAMQATYLATLAAPCPEDELRVIDAFQGHPHRALTHGERGAPSGAWLFSKHLDVAYGLGEPGAVIDGLIAIGGQRSPADGPSIDEPDVFDLMVRLFPPQGLTFGDVLLDFAVARAFLGNRSTGQHLPDTAWLGDFGRPRFEWVVDAATLPRRLAPAHPVEATGATYVYVDLGGGRDRLQMQVEWEESFVFRWSLVQLDAEGRMVGRRDTPELFGQSHALLTVEELDGVAAVLVVGTSLGHDDRSRPFDPDDGPPPAASYELTLR